MMFDQALRVDVTSSGYGQKAHVFLKPRGGEQGPSRDHTRKRRGLLAYG